VEDPNKHAEKHVDSVSRRTAMAAGAALAVGSTARVAFSQDQVKRVKDVKKDDAFASVKGLIDFLRSKILDAKAAEKAKNKRVDFRKLDVTFNAEELINKIPKRDVLAKIMLLTDNDENFYDDDNVITADGPHEVDPPDKDNDD